jgi:DNA polymerase-3 subunit beta
MNEQVDVAQPKMDLSDSAAVTKFEVTIDRELFLREISAALAVVERRTAIPILSNFLFEATVDELGAGRLTITATDLDQSLRTSCAARIKEPGKCALPARRLVDFVKLLAKGDITLEKIDNNWVKIKCGRSHTKMVGMPWDRFPQITEFPATDGHVISAPAIANLIAKTFFAISAEESRYTLSGALLVLKPESIAMAATDGHRIALIEKLGETFSVAGEVRTLLPRKACALVASLIGSSNVETIEFASDEQTIFFRIGEWTMTSRRLVGQFPNYAAVIPKDNDICIRVRTAEFAASIQRVAQFSDPNSGSVKLTLEKGTLKLFAQTGDSGQSEEMLEVAYDGEPMVVGFNGKYLSEFVEAVGLLGEIRVELKDGNHAAMLSPETQEDGVNYRYILMPMRVA